jgi:hypothetical protein
MDATDRSNLHLSSKLIKGIKNLSYFSLYLGGCDSYSHQTDEACVLFSPLYSAGHTCDIVTFNIHGGTSYEYQASLTLYKEQPPAATYSEWVILLVNPFLCESPVDTTVGLLEGFYERAGMKERDT